MKNSQNDAFQEQRRQMVEQQLRKRSIADAYVLKAMEEIPRHLFVDPSFQHQAYDDHPLPIGGGQTISQPYMVARMVELCELKSADRVLEVGAGSGYQTAVLALLCQHVYATEILKDLTELAISNLKKINCLNVSVEQRDGSQGWLEHAPFNAILVAASAPNIPETLKNQLADGGHLVLPVGGHELQTLQRLTRRSDGAWEKCLDTLCRFVKLRGKYGWNRGEES